MKDIIKSSIERNFSHLQPKTRKNMLESLFRVMEHDPHFKELVKKLKSHQEYQKLR